MQLDQATIDAANQAAMPRAMAELERRQRERAEMPLVDFVAANRAGYARPVHLSDYATDFDKAEYGRKFLAVTAPPRHGKTETTLAECARLLRRKPRLKIAYAAYSALVSYERSKLCADMARRAGVRMAGTKQRAALWKTEQGGVFFATSVNGSFTSFGFDLIIVDDPHKDRAEAESSLKRQKVHDWFSSTARSRLEPGGSIVVTHTRWHPDDLIGHLLAVDGKLPEARRQWISHKFPARAINDAGEMRALWPERYSLDDLQGIEDTTSPYDWASLYMCEPRPRGDRVFEDTYFYDWNERPTEGLRYAIGVDLAYTANTQSDHSVAVVMAECKGKYYVIEVLRRQCAAPEFAEALKALAAKYPSARMRSYAYGPEKGSIDFMRKQGLPRLVGLQASGDKFVRALPLSAAWNAGKVLLPEVRHRVDADLEAAGRLKSASALEDELQRIIDDSPDLQEAQNARLGTPKQFSWIAEYVSEFASFTGDKSTRERHDDQVDATAAAFDLLYRGAGGGTPARRNTGSAVKTYESPFSM